MSDVYFKIFKRPEDNYEWNKYIEYLKLTKHVPDEETRNLTIEALEFLQQELGKHFLKSCKNSNHPLAKYLFERGPDSYRWLIHFKDTLQKLKGIDSNYHKLLALLRPVKKCHDEGLPFINISKSLLDCGFKIKILPDVNIQKKPDLEIFHIQSQETIFIEVNRPKSDTAEREKIRKNSRALFKILHQTPPYVEFSCLQKKYLNDEDLKTTIEEIIKFKIIADGSQSFEIVENERIELAVASKSKEAELKKWCELKGDRPQEYLGLNLDFDDSFKIRDDKILQEAKQLPFDKPGVIYIQMNPLFFWSADLEATNRLFQSKLKMVPNILGIVLFSYIGMETQEICLKENMHCLSKRMVTDATSRTLFFVYNESFNLNLRPETLSALYDSFERF